MTARRVPVEAIGWAAALLPLAAGLGAYLISASQGLVPWCVTPLEGCTSISRAGRHGLANAWFRALMLPAATVLALYWWLMSEWLRVQLPSRVTLRRAVLGLGVTAAAFLVLYATFLGMEGETYQWLRRYGINVFFAFTVLAQLLVLSAAAGSLSGTWRKLSVAMAVALVGLGVASLPLQYLVDDRDAALNAIEWTYSLLMMAFFPLGGRLWTRSGFALRVGTGAR